MENLIICPFCQPKGCLACKGEGVVDKWTHLFCARELKVLITHKVPAKHSKAFIAQRNALQDMRYVPWKEPRDNNKWTDIFKLTDKWEGY